ncbi:hypothetical protein JCM10207_003631 [Rhodosporidiobolus poonsookiae]
MGRSAKLMKRPNKADRTAKKINAQSAPSRPDRSPSPDGDADSSRSAIPLFNTSARGRAPTKPDPRLAAAAEGAELVDAGAGAGADAMDESDGAEEEDEAPAASKKKKAGGLRDKVRKAKEGLRDDEARTAAKLGGKRVGKGKKEHVLKGVDYVELLEKRPGKKRFR